MSLRTWLRAVLRGGTVACAAVALAACHGLPSSSPVTRGPAVGRAQPEGVRVIPRGPVPGSDPDDLVLDFLRAGLGAGDDAGVARGYLTPRASEEWHPDGSALVYEDLSALRVTVTGPGQVTVTGRASAQLDAEGHYLELPSGESRTTVLRVSTVDGEWRISGGLGRMPWTWISRADFGLYASYPLTYATPAGDVAVTDRRWFLQGPGLLTRLTRAQLAPPPSYLQGAVITGVPEYTDLALGAVPIENGIAQVALTRRALNADEQGRALMWQQLTSTLTAVTGVQGVQLEADGSRLSAAGLPDRPLTPADLRLRQAGAPSSPVLRRSREGLERLDAKALSEAQGDDRPVRQSAHVAEGPPLPTIDSTWFHLAQSGDSRELAGLSGDLRSLARWRDGRRVQKEELGSDLTRPAYDSAGYLWTAGGTDDGPRIFVLPVGQTARPAATLAVPWLAGRTVLAVRPSPEGQRVLVASRPTAGQGPATVVVAGVQRKDGRPVGLATPITVAGGLTQVTDATWLDDDDLGVVGRSREGEDPHVVVAQVSGPSQSLGAVPGATSVTSFGGTRNIVVTTRRDLAMVRSGNRFVPLVSASDIVVPGR